MAREEGARSSARGRLRMMKLNPEMTSFAFRRMSMITYLTLGNAFAQVIRNYRDEWGYRLRIR